MSVLIKSMEMPNNCINCAARHGAECWLADCSYIPNYHKERPKWCPLGTLPPHGRLGDLDALFKQVTMDEHFSALEAMYVQSLISNAPTIIPASEEGET